MNNCHFLMTVSYYKKVTDMDVVVKDSLHAKARLSPNGRVLIPAAIREEMGFAPGESLLIDVEDGVLRIESYRARIRRIQREIAQFAKPGILASDELIAERREEARREEEEIECEAAARRAGWSKADQVA
jgi:AbrB family looped-hinge helix DNA binding protein